MATILDVSVLQCVGGGELSTVYFTHETAKRLKKIHIWLIYIRHDACFAGLPFPELQQNVIKINASEITSNNNFHYTNKSSHC
jgi:hypothetical protein